MLGKDIKKLILLYKECIDNDDNIEELFMLEEDVLKSMINEIDLDGNMINEDLLSLIYEVAFLEIEKAVKLKCIEVIKKLPVSVGRSLVDKIERLESITYLNNPNLLLFIENFKMLREEDLDDFDTIMEEFINNFISYRDNEDRKDEVIYVSFDFAAFNLPYFVDLLNIKQDLYSWNDSKVVNAYEMEVENVILLFSKYVKEVDVDKQREFVKRLVVFQEEIFPEIPDPFLNIIYPRIGNFALSFDFDKLNNYMEFLKLIDYEGEVKEFPKILTYLDNKYSENAGITSVKVKTITEIFAALDYKIDQVKDILFITKLLDLTMCDLERVRDFCIKHAASSYSVYEMLPFFTDPKIIEKYDQISEYLKSEKADIDKIFDYGESVVDKVEDAMYEDDETLNSTLNELISDETDYAPMDLRLNYVIKKKKFKFKRN